MEALILDPNIAPDMFRLLNDKVTETKRALEAAKKESADLRAQLARVGPGALTIDLTRDDDDECRRLQHELETARLENRQLKAEIADLSTLFEHPKSDASALLPVKEEPGAEKPVCSGGCPNKASILALEANIDELETKLNLRTDVTEKNDEQMKELRAQLASSTAAYDEQQHRNNELSEQMKTMKTQYEQKETLLQQELQLVIMKYQKYKAQFQECHTNLELLKSGIQIPQTQQPGAPAGPPQTHQPTTTTVVPTVPSPVMEKPPLPPPVARPAPRSSPAEVSPARAKAHYEEPVRNIAGPSSLPVKPEPWFQLVNRVLSNPCFPLENREGPLRLPQSILRIIPQESVLCCQDRIIYPYQEGRALLVAPRYYCKFTSNELCMLNTRRTDMDRLVGSTREVFYHSPDGICYAGTFLCTDVRDVSLDEYNSFPEKIQHGLRLNSFTQRKYFFATSPSQKETLRQWYLSGKMRVDSILMRYTGFNQPLFEALLALKAMDVGGSSVKRSWTDGGASDAKRTRQGGSSSGRVSRM